MPTVEGATTRCGSTADVAPERSKSAWSMCEPPATRAWTKGENLATRHGPADTSREADGGLDEALEIEATDQAKSKPALATRFGSSKVTEIRSILRDTDFTESASSCWVNRVFEQHNSSRQGCTFRGYAVNSSGHLSVDAGLVQPLTLAGNGATGDRSCSGVPLAQSSSDWSPGRTAQVS